LTELSPLKVRKTAFRQNPAKKLPGNSPVNNQSAAVFKKKQIAVAFIVSAAAMIAVPIFVFCMLRLVRELAVSSAAPRAPAVAEKLRQLAAIAEARIRGQTDK